MAKLYQILGLRDIDEYFRKEFQHLESDNIEEVNQIKNGYNNPLMVSNILRARSKCLIDKIGGIQCSHK